MPIPATTRDATINIRVRKQQRELIDRAVEVSGRSRSDFMLEAACSAAEDVLRDQRLIMLDDDAWQCFNDLLDAPASAPENLIRLLRQRPLWEN